MNALLLLICNEFLNYISSAKPNVTANSKGAATKNICEHLQE